MVGLEKQCGGDMWCFPLFLVSVTWLSSVPHLPFQDEKSELLGLLPCIILINYLFHAPVSTLKDRAQLSDSVV